jgi:hypothetical protein
MLFLEVRLAISPSGSGPRHSSRLPSPPPPTRQSMQKPSARVQVWIAKQCTPQKCCAICRGSSQHCTRPLGNLPESPSWPTRRSEIWSHPGSHFGVNFRPSPRFSVAMVEFVNLANLGTKPRFRWIVRLVSHTIPTRLRQHPRQPLDSRGCRGCWLVTSLHFLDNTPRPAGESISNRRQATDSS